MSAEEAIKANFVQLESLKGIEHALEGIIAAIIQSPEDNFKKARLVTRVATAKVTGAATATSIFGLVSTFGTAGTGTAIGSLSGAAATNATLAWIGGLVGGGMAAGAVILPAAGIGAGVLITQKLGKHFRNSRKLDELKPFEDRILFAAHNLLRPLDALGQDGIPDPSANDLRIYVHDGLSPLLRLIQEHFDIWERKARLPAAANDFRLTLKRKYQKKLGVHCRNLKKITRTFSKPIPKSKPKRRRWFKNIWNNVRRKPVQIPDRQSFASVALAKTFKQLLAGGTSDWSSEQCLVLDALRRSTITLNDASTEELAHYVSELSPEALQGVISNTKGIYHEMLFVQQFNYSDSGDLSARLIEVTNHPGADVQYVLDGEVVKEVQLKAVSSPTLIFEHMQRYPDIELLATSEMAAVFDGINSTGLSNSVLTQDVTTRLYELRDKGMFHDVTDRMVMSLFVTSGILVYRTITSRDETSFDYKSYLSDAGIAAGTSSIIDGVLSTIGN